MNVTEADAGGVFRANLDGLVLCKNLLTLLTLPKLRIKSRRARCYSCELGGSDAIQEPHDNDNLAKASHKIQRPSRLGEFERSGAAK